MTSPLVERLAALYHEQWSGWAGWMLDRWLSTHPSGEAYLDRWRRQIATPYGSLSEEEKESDRIEARKALRVVRDSLVAELVALEED